ncbi:unnamed protein product [Arabidopsis halleri]
MGDSGDPFMCNPNAAVQSRLFVSSLKVQNRANVLQPKLSLNSGNPILKSYDIIAVRPMNQNAFDYACEKAKVGEDEFEDT